MLAPFTLTTCSYFHYWLIFFTWKCFPFLIISPSLGHLIGNFLTTLTLKSRHSVWNMCPQLAIIGGTVELMSGGWNSFFWKRGARQNMHRIWDFNFSSVKTLKSEVNPVQFWQEQEQVISIKLTDSTLKTI